MKFSLIGVGAAQGNATRPNVMLEAEAIRWTFSVNVVVLSSQPVLDSN